MIKKNQFFVKNLKTVVFIGESDALKELIKINNSLNLKTIIITSSHQSKKIDKKINFKIFDKLNLSFKNYIKKNCKIENSIFIGIGARFIFKKKTINDFFNNNLVNFHDTRLPLDAGGGGFSWKIMREDRIDNQLVHLVDEGLDTGPIIDNKASLFPRNCRIPIDFDEYRIKKFIIFYKNFIRKISEDKSFNMKTQLKNLGRYNPRLNSETDGLINWDMDSYDLFNFINAFDDPYCGASTYLNNGKFGKLFFKKVHLHGGDSSNHPFMSGIVSRHDNDWIVVSTKSKHMLLVEEVLNRNGTNILNKIKVGDRFFTPINEISDSKSNRTFFNSKGLKKKKI
jgi:methionyl-tRNA formyltransferase